MNVDLYDFELPEELIAQTPLLDRTLARLLTLNKETGEVAHHHFPHIINVLEPGDTLILNDTRVLPARLFGTKEDTGQKPRCCCLKTSKVTSGRHSLSREKLRAGAVIVFSDELKAVINEVGEMGARTLTFEYNGIFQEILDRLGEMPLPPYIKETLDDRERYQTVYAKHEGSAAAPTAGLHFTDELLDRIRAKV